MAENTLIEWADHTFNPWIGCTKVSPGCDHCYAERREDLRLHRVQWGLGKPRLRTKTWRDPVKWNERAAAEGRRYRVFCASMADVFDNEVDPAWRADLFRLIARTPHLDWLLLTKRIGNAQRMLDDAMLDLSAGSFVWTVEAALPNVWIGATVVNQAEADRDIPKLLAVPARVRFLSIEPMLGHVEVFSKITGELLHTSGNEYEPGWINWVICGGESGPHARPMRPDWARSLRDQCMSVGVPFLFKQWGEYLPASADEADPTIDAPDRLLHWSDGSKWDRFDGQRAGVDLVARVGKKAAGRLLDGVEHNGFPS